MGEVYRAHDLRLERDVAVKVLPPNAFADDVARKRFRKEALALSGISHPNIAVAHDFDTQQGVDFLVTEYIPGITIAEKLASDPLRESELLGLGIQLAEGVAAAHKHGVVHRDLKPSNLRINNDGQLKVLDFGLAKLMPVADANTVTEDMTQAGVVMGTLPYMAPEQLRGEKVDARTDIYAIGAVLYEMATGRRPHTEHETPQLIAAILNGCPKPPRDLNPAVSPGLQDVIWKCLDCQPSRRYQSAAEIAVDLRRIAEPGSSAQARAYRRPSRLAALGITVAVLAMAASLYFGLVRGSFRGSAAAPHIVSLAVLPLQDFSGDQRQEYFADGMTDELITQIAQATNLRVISRSSVMQYKKTSKTLPEIARELNVDAILEGSIEQAANRIRVQAQLIYAPQDRHLWAQHFDRDMNDVLALQTEVAQAIAQQVGATLSPAATTGTGNRKLNPQAHDAYLRGLSAQSLSEAVGYFEQAIKLEPDYAPAYAALADAYFFPGMIGLQPPNQIFPKMEEAALKAVEKDPNLAEAHGALAMVKLQYDWNFAAAGAEFRRALELNPSNAGIRHMYAHYLMIIGKIKESAEESRLAVQLDPAGEDLSSCLGWHVFAAGEYAEALAHSRKILQTAPNDFWIHTIMGWTYEQQHMFTEATTELQKASDLFGGGPFTQTSLAHVLAVSGKREQAQAILHDLQDKAGKGYVPAYDLAVLYVGLGDKNDALKWLQKASVERSGFLVYINWDPRFDVLRSDPRFIDILKGVGLPSTPAGRLA